MTKEQWTLLPPQRYPAALVTRAAAAYPSVSAAHARAILNLERLFEEEAAQLKRDVRSGDSVFQTQMDARCKLGRHRPLPVRQKLDDGSLSRVLWFDHGMRGGLIATGLGDEGGGTYELDAEKMDQQIGAVGYYGRIRDGLIAADALAPTKGWSAEVAPSRVLELCYGEFLPRWRWAFDPNGKAFATKKAPPLAEGYVLNRVRGPGNVAHLTTAARLAFTFSRTKRRSVKSFVDWLGGKLNIGSAVTPLERQLAHQLTDDSIILCALALGIYIVAARGIGRVPRIVQRRARLAAVYLSVGPSPGTVAPRDGTVSLGDATGRVGFVGNVRSWTPV